MVKSTDCPCTSKLRFLQGLFQNFCQFNIANRPLRLVLWQFYFAAGAKHLGLFRFIWANDPDQTVDERGNYCHLSAPIQHLKPEPISLCPRDWRQIGQNYGMTHGYPFESGKIMFFVKVVPEVGLEPTRLAAEDFESSASTIPPLGHCGSFIQAPGRRQPPKAGNYSTIGPR